MSGAICMELLTKDGWNPINDIESVIVSIRSLMVVGGGRIEIATEMPKDAYKKALAAGKYTYHICYVISCVQYEVSVI